MKLLIQKVNYSKVYSSNKLMGSISKGYQVYVGFSQQDDSSKLEKAARKLLNLRTYRDDNKGFQLSIKEKGYDIILIPQFTLYGDCSQGNRPNFKKSLDFDKAKKLFEEFFNMLDNSCDNKIVNPKTFGCEMNIENSVKGPVSLIIEI